MLISFWTVTSYVYWSSLQQSAKQSEWGSAPPSFRWKGRKSRFLNALEAGAAPSHGGLYVPLHHIFKEDDMERTWSFNLYMPFLHVPYVSICLDSCICPSVCVCLATATHGLILQAERKERAPNTSACWKHLFSTRQLFTFPAYWMSSGGYCSFAECIINRWTSRAALILGNRRNAESTVDTHITSLDQLLLLLKIVCSFVLLSVPSVRTFLCRGIRLYARLLYMRVYGVCSAMLHVWASYVAEEFPFDLIPASLIPMEWFDYQ